MARRGAGRSQSDSENRKSETGHATEFATKPKRVASSPGKSALTSPKVLTTQAAHQVPAPAATCREQHDPDQHDDEEQDIAGRIEQVDRDGARAGVRGFDRRLEGEGREHGSGGERRHDAVEVVGEFEPSHLLAHQHHHCDVGERVEACPEEIRVRDCGRGCAAERLDRHRDVAECPEAHADAECQAETAMLRPLERAGEDESADDQLERRDAPAVDRAPAHAVSPHEERDEVDEEHDPERAVHHPHDPDAQRLRRRDLFRLERDRFE